MNEPVELEAPAPVGPADGLDRRDELRLQLLVVAGAAWAAATALVLVDSGAGFGVYLVGMLIAGVLFAGAASGRLGLAAPILVAGSGAMLAMSQHGRFWWPSVAACVLVVVIAECCASIFRLRTLAPRHSGHHERSGLALQGGVATAAALAAATIGAVAAGWYVLSAGVAVALLLVAITTLRPASPAG
jgi:hypothetical protein